MGLSPPPCPGPCSLCALLEGRLRVLVVLLPHPPPAAPTFSSSSSFHSESPTFHRGHLIPASTGPLSQGEVADSTPCLMCLRVKVLWGWPRTEGLWVWDFWYQGHCRRHPKAALSPNRGAWTRRGLSAWPGSRCPTRGPSRITTPPPPHPPLHTWAWDPRRGHASRTPPLLLPRARRQLHSVAASWCRVSQSLSRPRPRPLTHVLISVAVDTRSHLGSRRSTAPPVLLRPPQLWPLRTAGWLCLL